MGSSQSLPVPPMSSLRVRVSAGGLLEQPVEQQPLALGRSAG